jgi:parvulin-like peptidyl-prolyl isomerase
MAEVNGDFITVADLDFERRLKTFGFPKAKAGEDAVLLEELIDRTLMLQQARKLGIQPSRADLDLLIQQASSGYSLEDLKSGLLDQGLLFSDWQEGLRQQWILSKLAERQVGRKAQPSEQEIKDYYWSHLGQFYSPEKRRLRQIVTAKEAEARKVLQEIQLGESFGQAAARVSIGPEASRGGDLGWVSKANLPSGLAEAAFSLKAGRMTPILHSPFGWHLLVVEAIQPQGRPNLAAAHAEIKQKLMEEKEQGPYQEWLLELRREAKIVRYETVPSKKH